jgi:hypothetical protein
MPLSDVSICRGRKTRLSILPEGDIGAMEIPVPQQLILSTREEKIAEAKRVIDAARERGIVLRLLGGLAVRFHCESLDFCERDHGDIDMVGHRRDTERIESLFAALGFEEVVHVRIATMGRQLQFARESDFKDDWAGYGQHDDDHIDVFLDTFKMDHAIDLTDRLELDDYTITVSDALITKLQMANLNEKDERDLFTLLQDLELGTAAEPGAIDVDYIAQLCARDWGLFYDVKLNLSRLRERLMAYSLRPGESDRVLGKLARLEEAIEIQPKSRAWRLRAKIGTHRPWHETVEEQE